MKYEKMAAAFLRRYHKMSQLLRLIMKRR